MYIDGLLWGSLYFTFFSGLKYFPFTAGLGVFSVVWVIELVDSFGQFCLTLISILSASISNEKSEARISEAPAEANSNAPSLGSPEVCLLTA